MKSDFVFEIPIVVGLLYNLGNNNMAFGKLRRGRQARLGMLPPNKTPDLAGENYCFYGDVPLEELREESRSFLYDHPDLLEISQDGGTQQFGAGPYVAKTALVIFQVGGPCTLLPNSTNPAPDPYGGYPTGYNWGYRDSNGNPVQYPAEFAASRGDAYGASIVHDQSKMDQYAADFTKYINNSFFDGYYIEGLNGGNADIFHGPQYTTPESGLTCGSTLYPKTCGWSGTGGLIKWMLDFIDADPVLSQYDKVFTWTLGCWWSGNCLGGYSGGEAGNRVIYHNAVDPRCGGYLIDNQYYRNSYADPNNSFFNPQSWVEMYSTTNTDEFVSNHANIGTAIHENGHRVNVPLGYSWSHDTNIGQTGSAENLNNNICPCQFNAPCGADDQGQVNRLEVGTFGTGPDTDECYKPGELGMTGPNGINPYNIMNYMMNYSKTNRPSNWITGSDGKVVNCITGPDPGQASFNGLLNPTHIHELPPNGNNPWEGSRELWLLPYDLKHIEPGSTFNQNSTGFNKILIKTPMSIDSFPTPGPRQYMYLSFYSRGFCSPERPGSQYLPPGDINGTLLVSWGPYRPHPTPTYTWYFNSVPSFIRQNLAPLGQPENTLELSRWSTENTHGDPSYFPGWNIEVVDEIKDSSTGLRLAIKLRITSS